MSTPGATSEDATGAQGLRTRPRHALPLTSLQDTRQNVAAIAFVLGAVAAGGLAVAAAWPHTSTLGMYISAVAVFHELEYVVTATYNPTRVTTSCGCRRAAESSVPAR